MRIKTIIKYVAITCVALLYTACTGPTLVQKTENKTVPVSYTNSQDTTNTAKVKWKKFFTDPYLANLIDTALQNNQELNIMLQEINIAKNEVRARKGEYLPFVNLQAGAGIDKVARYTQLGALEENNEIKPGQKFPDPLPNYLLAANASWEVDIWKKLRNAKKSAMFRYLSTTEGKTLW